MAFFHLAAPEPCEGTKIDNGFALHGSLLCKSLIPPKNPEDKPLVQMPGAQLLLKAEPTHTHIWNGLMRGIHLLLPGNFFLIGELLIAFPPPHYPHYPLMAQPDGVGSAGLVSQLRSLGRGCGGI